jgi:uncharacterized protein (DUF58 family)
MPAWDEAAVTAAAKRIRLALDPRRRRHGQGTRIGSGPGASLEFHDHRSYQPGDDLRHLDWGVYARTDQLVLRRHRVEVSPVLEILLDCSSSVDAHPGRFAALCGLAATLATLAEVDGGRPRVWALGSGVRRLGAQGGASAWRHDLRILQAEGKAGLSLAVPGLANGSDRIIVSDGMCADGGRPVIERLGRGAGRISALHLLVAAERDPTVSGPVHLIDAELGERDVILDDDAIADYRRRLARHHADWQNALSGRGSGLRVLALEEGFDAHLRTLIDCGLVEVRA